MIDIVVLAFNQVDLTRRLLSSIDMFAPKGHRVILVDNGSTDATKTLKASLEATGHTYVRIKKNAGPYAAANAGLREVKTEVFANICNDVVLTPFALQHMAAALDDDYPIIGAVEFEATDYDYYLSEPQVSPSRWFPRLKSGKFFSCFVAKRSLFNDDRVGLYDESFKMTFGDTDWEQRFADTGKTYYQAMHAPVFHGQSVTRKRSGIEFDVAVDVKDYKTFIQKWTNLGRSDVVDKHPPERTQAKKDFLKNVWQGGKQ